MKCAGIDIGSRTIKLVVLEGGKLIYAAKRENSFDVVGDCTQMLQGVVYDVITATGYGRHLFAESFEGTNVISEIKAFAVGVNHLFPSCRTILDIGGQDTKAISIDEKGAVLKFEMNDKCAAGTGRFLEIMSMALSSPLAEFGDMALLSTTPQKINSMCTVFAESEVVSQLARGARREDVAYGIMQSVVMRSMAQLKRVGINGDMAFVGGVARNSGVRHILSEMVGSELLTPDDPQIVGAIGAAICSGR